MRWVGHVACTRKSRNSYDILLGKPEVTVPLHDLGVDEKPILERTIGKQNGDLWP
jgi:hypothetical protein